MSKGKEKKKVKKCSKTSGNTGASLKSSIWDNLSNTKNDDNHGLKSTVPCTEILRMGKKKSMSYSDNSKEKKQAEKKGGKR